MKSLTTNQPSHELDLLRLTSLIRERESSLLLLFEERYQRTYERTEWYLKCCEHHEKENRLSREIRTIVFKWALSGETQEGKENAQVRGFWLRVKMVMKMSLERVKVLGLLSYGLFEQYEGIIEAINGAYDRGNGIGCFREIEEMIRSRNRTIHELLDYSNLPSKRNIEPIVSDSKGEEIPLRPAYSMKQTRRECLSESKHKLQPLVFKNVSQLAEGRILSRPLSQENKTRFNAKSFLMGRKYKKVTHYLELYEGHLKGAMEGKIEVNLDRKRTIQQNIDQMYEELLGRNVGNHKMIAKFVHLHSGRASRKWTKRFLKPIKRQVITGETPKPKGETIKAKGDTPKVKGRKKVGKLVGRAVSAKPPRKLRDNRMGLSQVLGDIRGTRVRV